LDSSGYHSAKAPIFEIHRKTVHTLHRRAHNRYMDPRDSVEPHQLDELNRVFSDQLLACLDACARGRHGLFADPVSGDDEEHPWPEAARLRELAVALQAVLAQQEEHNALCDEFLDLCTMHGESHPGERRLARAFLERIELGAVGTPTEEARKPW